MECKRRGRRIVVSFFIGMLYLCFATTVMAQNKNPSLCPPTPEQQVIQLRGQLDKATMISQKKKLLKKLGKTGTFQALKTLERYSDDAQLKTTANKAAAVIRNRHAEYNGFQSLFNGYDLTGWKGLVENPVVRSKMTKQQLDSAQVTADVQMRRDWKVENGLLVYVGQGYDNICTMNKYDDFELYIDWNLDPSGKEPDAGIYLRGTPQVQIWDTARVDVGAQVGSGGLYNNQKNRSTPLVVADNGMGQWNSFYIKMVGDRVTVRLNGVLVVDSVVLENFWDRSQPIFPFEQIELQAHGSKVYYRNIYLKRLNNSFGRMRRRSS